MRKFKVNSLTYFSFSLSSFTPGTRKQSRAAALPLPLLHHCCLAAPSPPGHATAALLPPPPASPLTLCSASTPRPDGRSTTHAPGARTSRRPPTAVEPPMPLLPRRANPASRHRLPTPATNAARAPSSLPPASSSPRHGRATAKPRRRAAPPLSLHPAVSLSLQTSAPHSPHSPLPFPCTQSPNARREQSAAASHSAAPTPATRSPSSAHPRPQLYTQRASWPLTGSPKPAHHRPQATGELPPRYRPPPAVCSSGTPLPNPPPPEIALGIGPPPHPEALQPVLAAPPSPERRRRGAPPPPAPCSVEPPPRASSPRTEDTQRCGSVPSPFSPTSPSPPEPNLAGNGAVRPSSVLQVRQGPLVRRNKLPGA